MTSPAPLSVLALGDHFVLSSMLGDAVRARVPHVTVREATLRWPIEPFGPVAEVLEASGSEEDMITALAGVEVCVTQMGPLTERVLAACPDLRLFCVGRGGPVNVNLAAAAAAGVTVTYAPGRNATATAEHTVALMLAAARRVPAVHADLAAGIWRGDYYVYDQVGPELHGSTVGIVGFGAIGRRVAAIVAGFGAHVLISDPFLSGPPDGAEVASLADLLQRSDFVTVHARATPETEGMVSREVIASMRPGAVLVNCARGSLVDYDAVCDALDSGHLFGAGFDVFPTEPVPPGSRLLTTANVVMTPHLAGASQQTAANAVQLVVDEVALYAAGKPPAHPA